MTAKIFGYARVSTEDQSLDLQRDALRHAGCETVLEEKASGAKEDRSELRALLMAVREGDRVIVWKLDRLARSIKQLIETVEDLKARGVELVSLQEHIDTSSPGGQLVFHIFGALAEFEREMIRERTKAGLKAARARGRHGGRPKRMSRKDVITADTLLNAGRFTAGEVARRMGVSRSTLYRAMRTEV